DIVRVEQHPNLVPERAGVARRALVARRLTDEVQGLRRTRAGRVEEVTVAGDAVGPLETRAQVAAHVVVEERRRSRASRQAPLLETEDEDNVELPRASAEQVEDGNAPRVVAPRDPDREPLQGREDLFAGEVAFDHAAPLELPEQAPNRLVDDEVA